MNFYELETALRAVQTRARTPGEQTKQHAEQLRIIADFLNFGGVAPSISNEFHVLADALDDLKIGVVAPFLQHAKPGNRAAPAEVQTARALVAISLNVLVEGGASVRTASSAVALKAQGCSHLFGGNDFGEQARRWWYLLKAGREKSDEATEIWNQRQQLIDHEMSDMGATATPDAIASAILLYAFSQISAAKGIDEIDFLKTTGFFKM